MITVMPAYSDTLGERQMCHCKRGVTLTNQAVLEDSGATRLASEPPTKEKSRVPPDLLPKSPT